MTIRISPKKSQTYTRTYYEKNKEKLRGKSSRYYKATRAAIFEILGKKCSSCGFNDVRALQIDHVNSDGMKERAMYGNNPYRRMLLKIIEGKNDYQILCANCNWIKKEVKGEVRGNIKKFSKLT